MARVEAATLLIVGGADREVLALNRRAHELMRSEQVLEIVPGAGHLFEEPWTLERVVELSTGWFRRHLASHNQEG